MFWLQNLIIVVVSYLLSRIIIEEDLHKYMIGKLMEKSSKDPFFAVTGLLLLSYFFSIFLSNTVVVIAFIPIIKYILRDVEDEGTKSLLTTNFVLALIYGSNIGGMASLTGSAFNVLYIGFLEINKVEGRNNINFFTWLLIGVPLTLILIFIAKKILKLGTRNLPYNEIPFKQEHKAEPKNLRKIVIFSIANILFMFILSGLQFILQPPPVMGNFNVIDIIFSVYLVLFVLFAFIFPTERLTTRLVLKNLSYMALFTLLLPLISIVEVFREFRHRFRLRGEKINREMDNFVLNVAQKIWGWLHREQMKDLKKKNRNQLVSVNRLIYDLPFFGLFFIGLLLGIIYLVMRWGDNPATPEMDGYVYSFLKEGLSSLLLSRDYIFTMFLTIVTICIFLSEIINNATVIIIMLPAVLNFGSLVPINPLFMLLAVAVACCAAFMTPIGTNINAIAYASLEGVRIRRMIFKGLMMNTATVIILSLFFYGLHRIVFL